MVTTRPPKTIVKPTALGTVANTDSKLLIYRLFQKGRVLAQDGHRPRRNRNVGSLDAQRRASAMSMNGPTDLPSTATPASCGNGNLKRLFAAPLSAKA